MERIDRRILNLVPILAEVIAARTPYQAHVMVDFEAMKVPGA